MRALGAPRVMPALLLVCEPDAEAVSVQKENDGDDKQGQSDANDDADGDVLGLHAISPSEIETREGLDDRTKHRARIRDERRPIIASWVHRRAEM